MVTGGRDEPERRNGRHRNDAREEHVEQLH